MRRMDRYQASGVMPWEPPAGFVNPVPPARGDSSLTRSPVPRSIGDAIPAGNVPPPRLPKSQAELFSYGKVALGVLIALLFFGGQMISALGLQDKASDAWHQVEDQFNSNQQGTPTTPVDSATSSATTRGVSKLPGNYANVRFTPLPGQYERTSQRSIDSPYDGSSWQLFAPGGVNDGSVTLGYFHFVPSINSQKIIDEFNTETAKYVKQLSGDDVKPKPVTIDGHDGYQFKFKRLGGDPQLMIWFLAPEASYSFDCRVDKANAAMWKQCTKMARQLKFSR